MEKPCGLKATSFYVILCLLLVIRDWCSFIPCHTAFLIQGQSKNWIISWMKYASLLTYRWSAVSAGFIPSVLTPLCCWGRKKKNLEETYMAPKLSDGEEVSCGPLCQALDTQEWDCDKVFIMESTSEICTHRKTKHLLRSMLSVLKWFTKFPGG